MSEETNTNDEKKTILAWRWIRLLDKTFGIAAGLVLFVLMVVVTVDVVGRYIFSAPLQGAYEYIQIGMALLVFLAMPVITARQENVEVEVFRVLIPKPLRFFARIDTCAA